MNETLDPKRIMDMFWLFSKVLPIDRVNAQEVLGIDFVKLIPDLALVVGKQATKYPEDFNGFLEFIKQATAYIREETDEQPNIDQNQEILTKLMNESIEEFEKTAKPIKL